MLYEVYYRQKRIKKLTAAFLKYFVHFRTTSAWTQSFRRGIQSTKLKICRSAIARSRSPNFAIFLKWRSPIVSRLPKKDRRSRTKDRRSVMPWRYDTWKRGFYYWSSNKYVYIEWRGMKIRRKNDRQTEWMKYGKEKKARRDPQTWSHKAIYRSLKK